MKHLRILVLSCVFFAITAHGEPAETARPSEIFDVTQVDTPPKAKSRVGAAPPSELLGTSGKVILSVMVDAKGRPRDIDVVSSDHQYFSVAATNSLKKWRFTPGLKEGKPVSCRIQLPFVFRSNL